MPVSLSASRITEVPAVATQAVRERHDLPAPNDRRITRPAAWHDGEFDHRGLILIQQSDRNVADCASLSINISRCCGSGFAPFLIIWASRTQDSAVGHGLMAAQSRPAR
jgi:hypothetical protein